MALRGFVLRAADGKRDGIVRLRPFVAAVTAGPPCVPVSPDSCLPGPPPVGWWPQHDGSWDWEHEPPQVLVWRGTRFVPLPRAELSAIISETVTERAPL